jgi:hypothetical protein
MRVLLKNNSTIEVRRIVGENLYITTFEYNDGELITINNDDIVNIFNGEYLK